MDERWIKYAAYRLYSGVSLRQLGKEFVERRGYSPSDAYLLIKAGQMYLLHQ